MSVNTLSGFELFWPNFEPIRIYTLLFPLYPLDERHHLRAKGVELNAIHCPGVDLILVQ